MIQHITNGTCLQFEIGHTIAIATINYSVDKQLIICMVVLIAATSKLLFHKIGFVSAHIPESCLLILLGIILGAIIRYSGRHLELFGPHEFFNYLLPPIILEAAYSLHDRVFFNNFGSILIFAVLGTVLNWLLIGYSLYAVSVFGGLDDLKINTVQILLFSALISAVDPVAVLAVFQEIGVNPVLYFLVFGESLLNDGVTVVMYKVLQEMNQMTEIPEMQIFMAILKFFVVVFGGVAVGIFFGCITAIMTRFTNHVRVVEPIAMYGFAYMSHIIAELFELSGIISVIACGLVQVGYSFDNVTPKSNTTIKYFVKVMSGTCEIVIFLFLGLEMVTHEHKWHTGFTLWTLFFTLVYRFIITYTISFGINRLDEYRTRKITLEEQFIMSYGGLRGAVCFSLVALLTDECVAERSMLITTALAVIIFTVFIQGSTIKPLVRLLKITLESTANATMCVELNNKVTDHLMAGIEGIVGFRGKFRLKENMEHYNDKYLKRVLQRNPRISDHNLKQFYEKIALRDHWNNLYACNVKMEGSPLPRCSDSHDDDNMVKMRTRTQSRSAVDMLSRSQTFNDRVPEEFNNSQENEEDRHAIRTTLSSPRPRNIASKDLRNIFANVSNKLAMTHIDRNLAHEEPDDIMDNMRRTKSRISDLFVTRSAGVQQWNMARQAMKPGGRLLNVLIKAHAGKSQVMDESRSMLDEQQSEPSMAAAASSNRRLMTPSQSSTALIDSPGNVAESDAVAHL